MKTNLYSSFARLGLGATLAMLSGLATQAATIEVTPAEVDIVAGGTQGLSFSFTNNSLDYDLINYTALDQGADFNGSYQDLVGSQPAALVVGPGQTMSQAFNKANGTSAGTFTMLNYIVPGSTIQADLIFQYDVYATDPNSPNFNIFTDYLSSEQVSETLTIMTLVPEPAAWGLAGVGLLTMGLWCLRSMQQKTGFREEKTE